MDAFVICPDELIARRIHSGLERLGLPSLPLESLSFEPRDATEELAEPRQTLVLLGSPRFAGDEYRDYMRQSGRVIPRRRIKGDA